MSEKKKKLVTMPVELVEKVEGARQEKESFGAAVCRLLGIGLRALSSAPVVVSADAPDAEGLRALADELGHAGDIRPLPAVLLEGADEAAVELGLEPEVRETLSDEDAAAVVERRRQVDRVSGEVQEKLDALVDAENKRPLELPAPVVLGPGEPEPSDEPPFEGQVSPDGLEIPEMLERHLRRWLGRPDTEKRSHPLRAQVALANYHARMEGAQEWEWVEPEDETPEVPAKEDPAGDLPQVLERVAPPITEAMAGDFICVRCMGALHEGDC